MRNFEWVLGDVVQATGYIDFDDSVQMLIPGMAPIGFPTVAAMEARVASLPLGSQMSLRWVAS